VQEILRRERKEQEEIMGWAQNEGGMGGLDYIRRHFKKKKKKRPKKLKPYNPKKTY
jgi:hypothetical protein